MWRSLRYVFIVLLFGCSSSKVIYDYDLKSDFSQYKTFLFFADAGKGLNELDLKRFKRSIETELDSLRINPDKNPDFYINIIVEKTELEPNSIILGIGGAGRNVGGAINTSTSIGGAKFNEKVVLEFVDGKKNTIFWQAIINSTVRERMKTLDRVAYVEKIIDKILQGYPPK